jgi:hypothetical protein
MNCYVVTVPCIYDKRFSLHAHIQADCPEDAKRKVVLWIEDYLPSKFRGPLTVEEASVQSA